jgi:hypothetical protein
MLMWLRSKIWEVADNSGRDVNIGIRKFFLDYSNEFLLGGAFYESDL